MGEIREKLSRLAERVGLHLNMKTGEEIGVCVCVRACVSVSVSMLILELQATRRPISVTSGFRTPEK